MRARHTVLASRRPTGIHPHAPLERCWSRMKTASRTANTPLRETCEAAIMEALRTITMRSIIGSLMAAMPDPQVKTALKRNHPGVRPSSRREHDAERGRGAPETRWARARGAPPPAAAHRLLPRGDLGERHRSSPHRRTREEGSNTAYSPPWSTCAAAMAARNRGTISWLTRMHSSTWGNPDRMNSSMPRRQ
jgi:hypothetical protein